MRDELNNVSAQQDLNQLMSLGEKKRPKMIVDWLLGEDQNRRVVAEQLLLSDRPGSARLLVASALARWTRLSRRLQVLAAITRLGLKIEIDEVFDLFIKGHRFGHAFRDQALILVRNNHRDDDRAGGSSVATEYVNFAPASPMVAG